MQLSPTTDQPIHFFYQSSLSVPATLHVGGYLPGANSGVTKWTCFSVAGGTIMDHRDYSPSYNEAEGNIGAQSKPLTLDIGTVATNSEERHHPHAHEE